MPSVSAAIEQLDAIGKGAAITRLLAHSDMANYALNSLFDTTMIEREARAIFVLRPLLTPAELDEFEGVLRGLYGREWYVA